MKGKFVVFILIIATLAMLVLAWFMLQDVIVDYDLDSALSTVPYANSITKLPPI
ncbi:hypothetical protein [Virgibacillus halodenitrificans]|uniref:hypothetical protein n=1 Tax=Virgibacillus halodenitrificans TaxID=1482 RepID=UPI0002EC72F5|nr:hypothetical protein [Virgibacillus halodenitrificans]MCG1029638.1 hypothetical protein [Virgibacillus halodenitrificans]MCJ0932435.1 hypothetical protein [Virgibacillus halodenitrificans]MYL47258.1 hypothetical protein [Virgibacillus halodenitrificans]WHX24897.1 hypothetical protein QNH47_11955 [Virgibacillus halodenitrificans]CDQ32084.1 hypothetical protein BN993_01488 [Virgibacillus halodenitrificans]